MGQIGKIEKIQYCPQKGKTYIQTQERSVSVEKGLEGDYHGEKGDASLTLWTLEARTILENQDFPGICFQKFRENILVSGIDFSKVNQGDCLVAGKVRMKVEKKGKRCHPEVCTLGKDRKHCLLRTQTVFLKPLSDGILYEGEEIQVEEQEHE